MIEVLAALAWLAGVAAVAAVWWLLTNARERD